MISIVIEAAGMALVDPGVPGSPLPCPVLCNVSPYEECQTSPRVLKKSSFNQGDSYLILY